MKHPRQSEFHLASADRLVASLDGPSRTITVEPVQLPVPAAPQRLEPEPEREPPPREPERPREPAR
jgi:hypothetical protein